MSARPPSSPPQLRGFEYIRILGSGGFADVFLYQQQLPRRQVAVKVLLADKLDTTTVAEFTNEANVMAQLATHPSIVSIYEAGVSADGRPYLVMEYCSKPNLAVRVKKERLSEAETLRIGVQIAGAIETAHRAGILHRDIKPANILVTEYGRPALTDFGIAAAANSSNEASGMSVPWAAPESFASPARADATSDVYSLAATLYTLVSGHSPFEIPGSSNGYIDLIGRIGSMPVPAIGRAGVSALFEQVLRGAMAKDAGARPQTALAFARELQRAQIGLGMQATPIDISEEEIVADDTEDEGGGETRIRNVVSIDAQSKPSVPPRISPPAPVSNGPATIGTVGSSAVPSTTTQATGFAVGAPVARPLDEAPGFAVGAPLVPPPDETVRRRDASAAPPLDETVRRGDPMPADATVRRGATAPAAAGFVPLAPAVPDTVVRPVSIEEAEPRPRRVWLPLVVIAAAIVVVVGGVIAIATWLGSHAPTTSATVQTADSALPVDIGPGPSAVPDVQSVTGKVVGTQAVFSWVAPSPQPGDSYLWRTVEQGSTGAYAEVTTPSVSVPAAAAGRTCIDVMIRRADGTTSADPTLGCTP